MRSTNICVVDDQGELIAEGKTDAEVADIVVFLDELDVEITEVGLEAGTLTQYLTYGLQFAGFEVVCMEARQVKSALSAMRNKTDKHDARGIAQRLRSGWYSRVHIKSMQSHRVRALLASRKAVLGKCIDLENEIRGTFKVFGIKMPPRLGHGSFDPHVRPVIDEPSSQLPENSPSSFTECGSMTHSSDGVRRQQGHEITAASDPRRCVSAWTWSG